MRSTSSSRACTWLGWMLHYDYTDSFIFLYIVLFLEFLQAHWDMVPLFLEKTGSFVHYLLVCLSSLCLYKIFWTLLQGLYCDTLGPRGNNSLFPDVKRWSILTDFANWRGRGGRWEERRDFVLRSWLSSLRVLKCWFIDQKSESELRLFSLFSRNKKSLSQYLRI